jgi:K+-sensing histidine kinase KdpD
MWRKTSMLALGVLLVAIWITLAFTKLHALIFVCVVLIIGLSLRQVTRLTAKRRPKPSLLRRAIMEQLEPEALQKRRVLLGTYGSEALARAGLQVAKQNDAALVVCFIRQVSLSYKVEAEQQLTLDTDAAALRTFSRFLELAHEAGVPVIPVYDTGADAAILIAENAAAYACERVLIGTSRQGALYHLIKGHFQRRLEVLLPPDIPVQVIAPMETPPAQAA